MTTSLIHVACWAVAVFCGAMVGEYLIGRTEDRKIGVFRIILGWVVIFVGLVIGERTSAHMQFCSDFCWAVGVAFADSGRRPDSPKQ
jgi:hypothetical protein